MTFIPKSLTRLSGRTLLKLNAGSPTILVVAGVVGLGATAVLASKASRKIDPILDHHKQARAEIGYNVKGNRVQQKKVAYLYLETGGDLLKLYGPTLFVGTCSTVAILGGHNILRSRQLATMAAYSGLVEQFKSYRKRVADTWGEDVEKGIYEGARGEYIEDPDHKGEYKLVPKFDPDLEQSYLRPWFDEANTNWTRDPLANYLFLKGVQSHMNNLLQIRGHVFLNDVYDALRMERCREGAIAGWVWNSDRGDNYVDFGFMTSIDPHTVAFRNRAEKTVRLNFNIDGTIWDQI
jgi:Family of unknown function (DUF6353)